MSLLALDLGTHTGVAYGDAGIAASRVECETWDLPSGGREDVGPILFAFRQRLEDRLMRGISVLVFEAPFVPKKFAAPDQTRRAFGMAALCEEAAYARRIPCFEVVTSTIKKEFAHHGRADKSMMIAAAKRRGFIVRNDHEADAAACWMHAAINLKPEFAALYDPLFAGAAV